MRTNPHFEYEQDELDMEVHESAHRGTQAVLLTVTPAMQQHGAGGCEVRVCRICSILFEISPPCLAVFSVHRAYCVQANSGDCMCWGTAGKPVIYSNWTW